jgi:hypothetical protein
MWSHGQHLVDYNITLFWNSFSLPDVDASILSKLLISLMGFTRLGVIIYIQSTHEYTKVS